MGRRKDQRGAAAVEFALVLPIFIAIIFGIIQFGYYFWTAESANTAAREAARRVVVGDCWNSTNMTGFADSFASQTTSVSRSADPASLAVGDAITITVVADSEIINLIPGIPSTVTREYVARMEVDTKSTTANDTCTGY
jgi:Flp pilus assembly protein TadG